MSKYAFDRREFQKIVPEILRGRKLTSLLHIMLSPLESIYVMFLKFSEAKQYRLQHSGQVFSLQNIIREHCNNKDCYISDGEYQEETMVPYDGDGALVNYQIGIPYDVLVKPQAHVLYQGFSQMMQNDFIVHLPAELYGRIEERELRTLIDEYKVAGKLYSIVYDNVVVETYRYRWIDPVCAQEATAVTTHNYEWQNQICVIVENPTMRYRWTEQICVQKENFTTSKQ